MSILSQGGLIFYLISAIGIASMVIFFTRLLHLRRAQIEYNDLLKGIYNLLESDNLAEAIIICEETPGPVAAVSLTALRYLDSSPESLREAVENSGRSEIARLERRLGFIAITYQIAPLMGLLGTMLGVIKVVVAINTQAPVVQSTDLTLGLMQALVTTVAGLLVAIPCYIAHILLLGRVERIALETESAAAELIAYLTKPGRNARGAQ